MKGIKNLGEEWKPATVVFFAKDEQAKLQLEADEETDGDLGELVRQRALKGSWKTVAG